MWLDKRGALGKAAFPSPNRKLALTKQAALLGISRGSV
jgi:hypothetical protein